MTQEKDINKINNKTKKTLENKEIEAKLWNTCDKYLKYLKFIPFIKTAAVCNSLTFGNINEKSDIDLFIITEKNRLFIVRTFTIILFQLLGKRRHGNKIHNRFCLSFFIDESHLNLESIAVENDIYLAEWIENLTPFINDGTLEKFLQENSWKKIVLKKFKKIKSETTTSKKNKINKFNKSKILKEQNSKTKKILQWIFSNKLGNFTEKILQKWQMPRAKKKKDKLLKEIKIHNQKIDKESQNHKKSKLSKKYCGLIIKPNILKFHNYDQRRAYLNKTLEKK